jgi:cellulose synthase/poly-beta-1,6-N-acetylglucosamine synthase-like glycosyltransferase
MALKHLLSPLDNLERVARWERKHRMLPHFIVLALFSFLLAKAFLRFSGSDKLFFAYGLTVTGAILLQFTIALFFYNDPYKKAINIRRSGVKPLDADKPYMVSCLVAVFNEEEIIEKCVASVCQQSYQNKEIIFVDDCSTDKTTEILLDLEKKYPIRVITSAENGGKKKALCKGTLEAKGDIIAFTDSDSLWHPKALERIVQVLRFMPEVGAVSGHCRALNGGDNFITKVQDSWYEGQYSIRKAFESNFGAISCVSGPLAVFRRDAIYNYLPEWENDIFLGQEFRFATDRTLTGFVLGAKYIGKKMKYKWRDSEFAYPDYPIKDYKIVYTKSAYSKTNVPDTFSRVIKQQIRWKKSFIRNTFFTGRFYWRKPLPVALVYYLHILFVFAGPFIVLRHFIYFPLHGNYYSLLLYIMGITFIGYMFGLAFKLENPKSRRWIYRPCMSLLSTLVLSWLIFYSIVTIKQMKWHRG